MFGCGSTFDCRTLIVEMFACLQRVTCPQRIGRPNWRKAARGAPCTATGESRRRRAGHATSHAGGSVLIAQEVEVLLPMDNKIRDTVVAWLSSDVLDLLHTEGVRSDYTLELAASIRELRSICARHHGKSISFQPTDSTLCLAKFF